MVYDHVLSDSIDDDSLDGDSIDDDSLDDDSVKEFQRLESYYDKFYKTKTNTVTLFFIYVDNNNVESLHEEKFCLNEESKICSDELVFLIKNHKILHNKRYTLTSLLRYNFTMDPDEILQMKQDSAGEYLDIIKSYLSDIHFADTVSVLEDVNALFFVFSRETLTHSGEKQKRKKTNRVRFRYDLHRTTRKQKK